MLSHLLTSGTATDIAPRISEKQRSEQSAVFEKYERVISNICETLELSSKPVCHVPCSFGKDSVVVLLACIHSYKRMISMGKVEAARPLIVTTVDTLVESVAMTMVTRYCSKYVVQYAKKLGVNLSFELVSPRLEDEYFIRWGSASKLLSNPTRSGDCSKILKVETSERHIKELYAKTLNAMGYNNSPVISCLGSRDDESTRRKGNNAKSDLARSPLEKMQTVTFNRKVKIYQYAPIIDWLDEDVFLFHQMSGENAMVASLIGDNPFPSYFEHHGLMLAIYGNGKNEVCEVVVGNKNKQGASCGGKNARFGCYVCPQIGTIDKSTEALMQLPRWSSLGDVLPIRDYLYRLSASLHSRAFHPKAVDQVGFNRICLQPNVLKAKYLEKMVWYASSLSIDSKLKAEEFSRLVANGREMEDVGMQCIANDNALLPKVKRQFLDMYKAEAQSPLYTCFSEKHAVMLSFKWLVDGVATTAYKPMAIYDRVKNGERLPTPMTNREYEAKFGRIKISNDLPDLRMIRFHPERYEASYNPITSPRFLSFWQRPLGVLDMFDDFYNCSTHQKVTHELKLKVTATCRVSDDHRYTVIISKVEANNRVFGKLARRHLNDSISEHVERHYRDCYKNQIDADQFKQYCESPSVIELTIPHIKLTNTGFQPHQGNATLNSVRERTERVTTRKGGKIVKTTTRPIFYKSNVLHPKMANEVTLTQQYGLNFEREDRYIMNEQTSSDDVLFGKEEATGNITINDKALERWMAIGGWQVAIIEHDRIERERICHLKNLHSKTYLERQIRVYSGSSYAYELLRKGCVEVSPTYQERLMTIIKRTDIMSEIGAYDLASLSESQITQHVDFVTIAQHRREKVACVNAIRRARNALRAKRISHQFAGGTAKEALKVWFGNLQESLNHVNDGITGRLGGFIDTLEPPRAVRLASSRAYLAISMDALASLQSLLKVLLNPCSNQLLRADPKTMIELNQYTQTLVQDSIVHAKGIRSRALRISIGIDDYCEQVERGGDNKQLWTRLLEQYNSEAMSMVTYYPICTASAQVQIKKAQEIQTTLMHVAAQLKDLHKQLNLFTRASASETVKSMNVAETLNFLKMVS